MFVILWVLTNVSSGINVSFLSDKWGSCISLSELKVSQIPFSFSVALSVHSQRSHCSKSQYQLSVQGCQNQECWHNLQTQLKFPVEHIKAFYKDSVWNEIYIIFFNWKANLRIRDLFYLITWKSLISNRFVFSVCNHHIYTKYFVVFALWALINSPGNLSTT